VPTQNGRQRATKRDQHLQLIAERGPHGLARAIWYNWVPWWGDIAATSE